MTQTVPLREAAPARQVFTFDQLADTGVLWAINRYVFHPRGLALALDYAEGEDEPRGWSVKDFGASAGHPATYGDDVDEGERLRWFDALLAQVTDEGRTP